MSPRHMTFEDAMSLVPDDLPDGAFFALAHEIAGLDYGEGFDELAAAPTRKQARDKIAHRGERIERRPTNDAARAHKPFICCQCGRRFRLDSAARQHWRSVHAETRPQSAALAKLDDRS